MARVSTSNGSSLSPAAGPGAGRLFLAGSGFRAPDLPDAAVPAPVPDDFGEAGASAAGSDADCRGGAGDGFPVIDAPQNGQFSASSSRTEALQEGQLLNSMNAPFNSLAKRTNVSAEF
jgi:hypothetical protein